MGFSFRKSIRIAPGIRLNISTRGASISAGPKGAKLNVGTRGVRASAGAGGIRYQKQLVSTAKGRGRKTTTTGDDRPLEKPDTLLSAMNTKQVNSDLWAAMKVFGFMAFGIWVLIKMTTPAVTPLPVSTPAETHPHGKKAQNKANGKRHH